MKQFNNLTKEQKGLGAIVIGVSLLLFISGILIKVLYYPLLILSLGLIVFGVIEGDFINKGVQYFNSLKK